MKHENRYGSVQALIAPTSMDMDRAMQIINSRHARSPLSPESVYVFEMRLSSQALDSYLTRMSESTLKNYEKDFTEGRALLNSHRSGGFVTEAELPTGRFFSARIDGAFLPSDARFEDGSGATLTTYAYIQRGLKITDVSTDDTIRGIEGGTINDGSVGFHMGADGSYRCNLCNNDMRDYSACEHLPGMTYEVKTGEKTYATQRCFAWVENARGIEGSLVYKGGNNDAMITKAVRMFEAGSLDRKGALLLEETYGGRITGDKTFTKADFVTRSNAVVDMDKTNLDTRKEPIMWDDFLKKIRTGDPALADRITALPEGERLAALEGVWTEQRATINSLQPRAAMGDKWLDDLTSRAVAERVRAEDKAFNAETYRTALRATNDPAHMQQEIASWSRAAEAALGSGKRPTSEAKANTPAAFVNPRVYR